MIDDFEKIHKNGQFFRMSAFAFVAGFLSVYSAGPYFMNIRELYSPSASIPLFFVMLIDQLIPNQGFVIPLYKKIIMFFGGGFIGFLLSFIWLKLFFKSNKISNAYFVIFAISVVYSCYYFYNLYQNVSLDTFFYFYAALINIFFVVANIYIITKNFSSTNKGCSHLFHLSFFVWLMWCAFPYYLNVVTI